MLLDILQQHCRIPPNLWTLQWGWLLLHRPLPVADAKHHEWKCWLASLPIPGWYHGSTSNFQTNDYDKEGNTNRRSVNLTVHRHILCMYLHLFWSFSVLEGLTTSSMHKVAFQCWKQGSDQSHKWCSNIARLYLQSLTLSIQWDHRLLKQQRCGPPSAWSSWLLFALSACLPDTSTTVGCLNHVLLANHLVQPQVEQVLTAPLPWQVLTT